MLDYKIIIGSPSVCQKLLNQWKHEFRLVTHGMCSTEREVTILLTRERRDSNAFNHQSS